MNDYLITSEPSPEMTYYLAKEDLWAHLDAFADNAKAGRRLIGGEVSYQACNSRVCLFPSSLGLTLEVVVTEDD